MKKRLTALVITTAMILISAVGTFSAFAADSKFSDVEDGAWYADAVNFCAENGLMTGTGDGLFSPAATVTRATVVTVLAKAAGADLSAYASAPFDDVAPDAWYAKQVAWAYEFGCVSGIGNGLFAPNAPLSREQLAVILRAYTEKRGADISSSASLNYFTDEPLTSSWARDPVIWAVDAGLISGTGEAILTPRGTCTRAQLALIIKKYIGFYSSDCEHEWSKPSCTKGRVCSKCGYTAGTPLGHEAGQTCTNGGICIRCGKKINALGHIYSKSATCTAGVACARCGEVSRPLGHNYSPAKPTCTRAAKCTRCGDTLPALGHNYSPAKPTCTRAAKCTRCGDTLSALGHTTNNGVCARCGVRVYAKTTSKGYGMYYSGGAWHIVVGSDDIVIANKSYALDKDYNPGGITSAAQSAFNNLKNGAKKQGLNIWICSGFRSYSYQYNLYNRYVARDGKAEADRYSARPGHSEHQTGLAMDVNSVDQSFAYTAEGKWLAAHAHEYGFIIRYPKGKEGVTGYMYEPWHIRYLGVSLATKVYNSGLTLEEYVGVDSHY